MINKIISFFKIHAFAISALLLGVLYFWLITFIHDKTAGDFPNFLKEPLSFTFGVERWFNWSSRLLIEDAVNIFSKNLFLWQIITVACGAVLLWSVGRILNFKKAWHAIVIFCLFLLVNLYILTSAGVVATTINYLWPIACLAFVAAILIKPFENIALRRIATAISIPLLIFAICNEQVAALALSMGLATVAYMLFTKYKIPKILWVYLGIAILGIVNTLIAPGNAVRSDANIAYWWPSFDDIPLQNKLVIGSIVTFSRLFLAPEVIAIVLVVALLIFACVIKNRRAFVALLPAISLLFLFFFPVGIQPGSTMGMPNYLNGLREVAMNLSPSQLTSREVVIVFIIIFTIIGLGILAALLFLYGKTKQTYFMISLLGAGLAVSLVLSLSPTLFASGTRTLYPMVVALVVVNARIIVDVIDAHFSDRRVTTPGALKSSRKTPKK